MEVFWECLIGITKSTIKKVLGRAAVSLCTLQTIVVEAEALTPAHLLYGQQITSLPHPQVESDELSDPTYQESTDIQRKAKRVTLLIQHFWQRWQYFTSLQEFHRKSEINTEIEKVGDLVLIHDDGPRVNNWKLALVASINRGHERFVRLANVYAADRTTNHPITRLHPLEIQAKEGQNHITDATTTEQTPPPARRPQRDTA